MLRSELEKMSSELVRKEATKAGIKNCTKFKKMELIEMLADKEEVIETTTVTDEVVTEVVTEQEVEEKVEAPTTTTTEEVKTTGAEEEAKGVKKEKKEIPAELVDEIKSKTIRNLLIAGWSRGDIARALDIRYQHVREVDVKMKSIAAELAEKAKYEKQ